MELICVDRMKKSDLPQIVNLYQELVPGGVSLQTMENQYARIGDNPKYCLLTARREKKVLGTAMGIVCQALDTPFLVIENVVVEAACRKKGVGKKMFAALDEFAGQNGCQYALIVSSGFRKEAHQFYRAMGYCDDVRGFRKYFE